MSLMTTVLHQIAAGVRRDVAARQAQVSFRDIKALSTSVPPPRDALGALVAMGCGVIAGITRATPITREKVRIPSVRTLARQFEAAGANIVGCHTESRRFHGSLQDLREVSDAVHVPVLCQDFIIDPYQVHEARYFGADMVPLVVAALEQPRLVSLIDRVESLGMTALVEVHSVEDADRAMTAGAQVVGVNARTDESLTMDVAAFAEIAPGLPSGVVRVALSGVTGVADVLRYAGAGADAVMVGEELISAPDPVAACRRFVSAGQHPACPTA